MLEKAPYKEVGLRTCSRNVVATISSFVNNIPILPPLETTESSKLD